LHGCCDTREGGKLVDIAPQILVSRGVRKFSLRVAHSNLRYESTRSEIAEGQIDKFGLNGDLTRDGCRLPFLRGCAVKQQQRLHVIHRPNVPCHQLSNR